MSTYKPGIDDEDEDEVWGGQEEYDKVMDSILNPKYEKFSYNANSDPMYKQYEQAYTRNAKAARENTQAAMQSMSGGYGNSYAGVAAQQSYNQQMDKLNDVIPQLEQQAYQRYNTERDVQRKDNLNALGALNTDRKQWWTEKVYGDAQEKEEENNVISITEDAIESGIYDGTPEGEDALREQLAIHGLDEDTVETIVGHVINTWTTGNTILERDEKRQEKIDFYANSQNTYWHFVVNGGKLTDNKIASMKNDGLTDDDIEEIVEMLEAKKEERDMVVANAAAEVAQMGLGWFSGNGGWASNTDYADANAWLEETYGLTSLEANEVMNKLMITAKVMYSQDVQAAANSLADTWYGCYDGENMEEIKGMLADMGVSAAVIAKTAEIIESRYGVGANEREEADAQALSDANIAVIDLINGGKIQSEDDLDAVLENRGLIGTAYEQSLRDKFAEYQQEQNDADADADAQALSNKNLEVIDLINKGDIQSEDDLDAVLENRGLIGTAYEQSLRDKFAKYQQEQNDADAQAQAGEALKVIAAIQNDEIKSKEALTTAITAAGLKGYETYESMLSDLYDKWEQGQLDEQEAQKAGDALDIIIAIQSGSIKDENTLDSLIIGKGLDDDETYKDMIMDAYSEYQNAEWTKTMRSISNEIVQMDVYDERGDLKEGIFYDGLIDYLVDNYGLTDAEANAILGAARTSIMISSAASAADREKEELLALEEIKTLINNGAVSDYDSLNNWIKIYGLEFNAKYIEQLNGHLGDKLDADAKAEARKLASVNFDVLLLIENGSIMSETLLEAAIDVNGLKGTQYEQTLYDRFDEISLQRSIDDDTKNANEMADMWIDSYDGENMEEIKDALYDLYGDTYSETAIEKAASIIASVYGVGENSRENAAEQTLEDANFTVLAMIEEGSISSTYLLDAAITKWNLDGTEYEQELREKFETIQQENTQTEYTRQLNTWMDAAGNGNLSVSQRDQILGMRESGELSEDDFKKITEAYSSSVRAELSSGYVFADEYGDWMLGSDAKIMVEEALKDKFLSEDVKKTLVKKYNDKYAIYKCVYWNNGNPQPWGTSGDPASGKFELHHGDDKYLLTAGDVVNDEDILVAAGDLDNMTVFMKDNVLYVKGKAGEVYKCNNAGYIPGSTPGFNITNQFIDAVNNVTGNLTQIITDPKYYTGVTYG